MVDVHIKITLNPVTFHRDNYKILFKKIIIRVFLGMQYHMVTIGHTHTHTHGNGRDAIYAILHMNI